MMYSLLQSTKIMDEPISKYVYITDTELYDNSRIIVYTRAKIVNNDNRD